MIPNSHHDILYKTHKLINPKFEKNIKFWRFFKLTIIKVANDVDLKKMGLFGSNFLKLFYFITKIENN